MHFQSFLSFSFAALAGTVLAAEYNGGEIPSYLYQGRNRNFRSSVAGSSSVATPASSSAAMRSESAMMVVTVTVTPTPTPTASSSSRPSPTTFALHKSSGHGSSRAASSSHHVSSRHASSTKRHRAVASSTPLVGKIGVPTDSPRTDKSDEQHQPFWNTQKNNKPAPEAPDFVEDNAPVNDKDACSLRCQDLANQCLELLPGNDDYCWSQYPSCQDLCVKEHVDS
ncbi:hypothetical protein BGW36DRAFT_461417 [Talaromyces proteolyticus]|uniref:Uncharacterized protein n=1 Tax=Talaromyces proteolyticus TaxID=1131652 RepID=A0AAD4KR31_9EURO|nr:uncharacterized protein BGW36DRAFT_461417 [Talaromyces proteolyticus]KAH8697430.1 hypothetical protein BGW36DRAFT_461417 [Talaromyces proteolyticus]